jgi:hypothetical protein
MLSVVATQDAGLSILKTRYFSPLCRSSALRRQSERSFSERISVSRQLKTLAIARGELPPEGARWSIYTEAFACLRLPKLDANGVASLWCQHHNEEGLWRA